ncbi:MAG: GyrI-like domain-containing protein [Calditrichia bacterium]
MEPQIVTIEEKKLIGMSVSMSLVDNKTFQVFSTFMPRKKEILNAVNSDVLDMRVFPENYYTAFSPAAVFEKWAAVEVAGFDSVPDGMQTLTLPGGQYAVFHRIGLGTDNSIFEYIFTEWLPHSGFQLDNRPHFDVMGEKFKRNDPNSEEDICIPVK